MDKKREKIIAAYEALARVTTHFWRLEEGEDDADDFLETMMVTESLIDCGGFNHRDMVARFRRGRRTEIGGKVVWTGNRDPRTQMAKLRSSGDPFYLADDGITNGAAMRMLGVALYFPNFREMVYAANAIARITHASTSSRMAAVAVALRLRQLFMKDSEMEKDFAPPLPDSRIAADERTIYVHALRDAALLLGSSEWCSFMQAFRNEFSTVQPSNIDNLNWRTGFMHVATSSPLAAIMASFLPRQVRLPASRYQIEGVKGECCDVAVVIAHRNLHVGEIEENERQTNYPHRTFASRHDSDTFYSMLHPMYALREPFQDGLNEVFENYANIAEAFVNRWERCR